MMPIFAFFVVLVSKVSLAYLDMIMVEITTRLIKNGISPHARKGDTRRGVHARVSHALLSLRKNGGLLVVYFSHHLAHNLQPLVLCISRGGGGGRHFQATQNASKTQKTTQKKYGTLLYLSFLPCINIWDQKVQTSVFYEAFLTII